jgi:hypothetical protein
LFLVNCSCASANVSLLTNAGTDISIHSARAGQGSKEMDKKNDQIAHRRIVPGREILRKYGRNNNSPATGYISCLWSAAILLCCARFRPRFSRGTVPTTKSVLLAIAALRFPYKETHKYKFPLANLMTLSSEHLGGQHLQERRGCQPAELRKARHNCDIFL